MEDMYSRIADALEGINPKECMSNLCDQTVKRMLKKETGYSPVYVNGNLKGFSGDTEYFPEDVLARMLWKIMKKKEAEITAELSAFVEGIVLDAIEPMGKFECTWEEVHAIEVAVMKAYNAYCKEHGIREPVTTMKLVTNQFSEINTFLFYGEAMGFYFCTPDRRLKFYLFPSKKVTNAIVARRDEKRIYHSFEALPPLKS